ncbi:peptidylprolyl isomerase [Corynebacterium hansenii]|uniref:Peptidylprolyl isomerase n=1 Tax=Corynebacterium hansenii TaxID=394964 RepID=A0ABV7ZQG0_9CORY|nr:peptidylprolyl isomerase [Corynebacterium hansenii]WJY99905.1 Putative bifunctional phosphatase/peptidyl-prolyl cis-trans isomerase [Corynebacterium hansenii]
MQGNEQRRREAMKNLERELGRRDRAEKVKPLGVVVATLAILVVLVGGIWFLTTMGGEKDDAKDGEDVTASQTPTSAPQLTPLAMARAEKLPDTVTCKYPAGGGAAAKEVSAPSADNVPATGKVTVTLKTNQGDIPMELDRSLSPCGVNAIEHLAKEGYYNDTVCHRMTAGSLQVLQCGDPTGTGAGGPGFTFADEYPKDQPNVPQETIYPEGSIAMANSGPDTNGSQFFLNYGPSQLQPNYSVLGTMTPEGLKVAKGIAGKGIDGGQTDGKPKEEVRIETATVS